MACLAQGVVKKLKLLWRDARQQKAHQPVQDPTRIVRREIVGGKPVDHSHPEQGRQPVK